MVIIAALAGGVVSLIGGLYLLYGRLGVQKLQRFAVPFAAGALLAASFIDLLPEALEMDESRLVLLTVLGGFIGFFLLERFLRWFHHHHEHPGEGRQGATKPLIIIGDTLHNFIDGLAIGVAFLVSPATGIITTVAVAAHEIPQEIGDFGLLLSKGMAKKRIVIVNIISALATVAGAALAFGLGDALPVSEAALLAITAGFFIYIAASDIIPTIHAEQRAKTANIQAIVLLIGILFVGVTTTLAHDFAHPHSHDHSHEAHHGHEDEYEHDEHHEE